MKILEFSEDTITVYIDENSLEDNNSKLLFILGKIESTGLPGIVDYSLSYNSLVIYYEPESIETARIKEMLERIERTYSPKVIREKKIVEIPVCYDGEYGLDHYLFQEKGLSKEDIVALHTEPEYLIYMIGFLPGFPFLNGVHEKLKMERLSTPRTAIPKGSVGIAGSQTGLYPLVSPGGWNIIGRTPVTFNISDKNMNIPFAAGDYIKFTPIDRQEFEEIEKLIEDGAFKFVIHGRGV